MPESLPEHNLRLRLSFNDLNRKDIDQWETSLLEKGVEVVGKSATGLDVEAPVEMLQEALDVNITIDGEDIRVDDVAESDSREARRRPHMYSPRRPTMF